MARTQNIKYNQSLESPSDLWDVTIENTQLSIVFLKGTIMSKENGPIYAANTSHFQLPVGSQIVRSYLFSNVNVIQSSLEDLNGNLGVGNYTFRTELIDYYSQQILADVSFELVVDSIKINQALSDTVKDNRAFQFKLNGDINSQYDVDIDGDYNVPEYARFNINPTVILFDIPFNANAFITTENKQSDQNINFFNFNFDYNEYQRIIIDKLLDKVESSEKLNEKADYINNLKENVLNEKVANYDTWKQRLEDPEVKDILEGLKDVEALSKVVNDKGLKDKYNKALDIEKQIKNGSIEDLKEPLQLLERNGVSNEKLNKLYEKKGIVDLLKGNTTSALNQIGDLKTLKNPKEYLTLLESYDIEEIANLKSKTTKKADKVKKKGESKANKVLDKLPVGLDANDLKNLSVPDVNELKSKGINKVKEEGKKRSKKQADDLLAKLPAANLDQYIELSKKWKGLDTKKLQNLNENELNDLVNNYDSKTLKGVKKLADLGIENKDDLTKIGSFDKLNELINIKGEYGAIVERYEDLLGNKKAYKKTIKVKEQIEEIQGKSFRELLSDPKNIKSTLQSFDLTSTATKLFGNFRAIELGDYYPVYNDLMLNGVKAKGVNIEMAPGKFYTAVLFSKTQEQVFLLNDSSDTQTEINKYLFGGKFGLGEKNENHIHFNYLYGFEQIKSTTSAYEAGANHVFGADFFYSISDKLNFEGEVNGSISNPNKELNNELRQSLQQKGWAYKVKASYNLTKSSNLYASTEQISAFYKTFGLPYLISDRLSIESGYEHAFLNNQLSLKLFGKRDINGGNLYEKNVANSANINLLANPSNRPFVNLFYNLIFIDGQSENQNDTKNITHNASISTGYSYKIKSSNLTSQITYAYQYLNNENLLSLTSNSVEVGYTFFNQQEIHTINLSQQLVLQKLKLSANASINKFQLTSDDNSNLYSVEGTIGIPIFKGKLNTLIGGQYSKLGDDNKVGGFAQASFAVTKYLNFNLNCGYEQVSETRESERIKTSGIIFNSRLNFNF